MTSHCDPPCILSGDPPPDRPCATAHSAPKDPGDSPPSLYQSLKTSIERLRDRAQRLQLELDAAGADALDHCEHRQFMKLDQMLRDCQKVEKTFVELESSVSHAGGEFDLETARLEILSRLDRLRAALGAGGAAEGAD